MDILTSYHGRPHSYHGRSSSSLLIPNCDAGNEQPEYPSPSFHQSWAPEETKVTLFVCLHSPKQSNYWLPHISWASQRHLPSREEGCPCHVQAPLSPGHCPTPLLLQPGGSSGCRRSGELLGTGWGREQADCWEKDGPLRSEQSQRHIVHPHQPLPYCWSTFLLMLSGLFWGFFF